MKVNCFDSCIVALIQPSILHYLFFPPPHPLRHGAPAFSVRLSTILHLFTLFLLLNVSSYPNFPVFTIRGPSDTNSSWNIVLDSMTSIHGHDLGAINNERARGYRDTAGQQYWILRVQGVLQVTTAAPVVDLLEAPYILVASRSCVYDAHSSPLLRSLAGSLKTSSLERRG